jgi:uncharacterized membrane protein
MLDKLKYGTYILFASFCLLMFLWVFFFLPETRYKTLEEMDEVFGDNSATVDRERMQEIMGEIGLEQTPHQIGERLSDEKDREEYMENTKNV